MWTVYEMACFLRLSGDHAVDLAVLCWTGSQCKCHRFSSSTSRWWCSSWSKCWRAWCSVRTVSWWFTKAVEEFHIFLRDVGLWTIFLRALGIWQSVARPGVHASVPEPFTWKSGQESNELFEKTVEIPQVQFSSSRAVNMQRQVPAVRWVQTVQKTIEFPQVQFLGRVLDVPVVVQRQVRGRRSCDMHRRRDSSCSS